MIIFVHYGLHGYAHKDLVKHPDAGDVGLCNYQWLLNCQELPVATYIFVDRERMDVTELRVFSALFNYINALGKGYRAINNPARMMNRRGLLRTLYVQGCNDFNAYPVTERLMPQRFPVFVRREFDHAKPLTGLLDSPEALQAALQGLLERGEPEEGLLITEYCAEPVAGTLFRKLSAYNIGGNIVFYNAVHEENWLVKYGTLNAATDALYLEEQKMVLENTYQAELKKVFELAGIDYGRADFGVVNGRVQVYEINTNPATKPPHPHPNPIRVQTQELAWQNYCSALKALDTGLPVAAVKNTFRHANVATDKNSRVIFRN